MSGFLARFVVTHSYIFFSRSSSMAHATPSAPLECSPTINLLLRHRTYPRLLSTHGRSTSELLRTR
nr:hypothetical protein [uncultured bacterium]